MEAIAPRLTSECAHSLYNNGLDSTDGHFHVSELVRNFELMWSSPPVIQWGPENVSSDEASLRHSHANQHVLRCFTKLSTRASVNE